MPCQLSARPSRDDRTESRLIGAVHELVAGHATGLRILKKRTALFTPGDPSDSVYLLRAGRIKIACCAENGRELTLAIHRPGDLLGLAEAFDRTLRETFAVALEDSVLAVIPRHDFLRRLQESPELAMLLTKLLLRQLQGLQARLQDLGLRDVPARLARLLLELGEPIGTPGRAELRIGAGLTHQEMANLLGCARETVSTVLGQFRKQGLIRPTGKSIMIAKMQDVMQLAV